MKKKTLYVTDLDGTLLGGDSRISNASAEMLTRLADAGVMFTAATARTPATVQPLMRNVGQSVYIDSDGVSQSLPGGTGPRAALTVVSLSLRKMHCVSATRLPARNSGRLSIA